ncbi:MAG: hypothetical protein Q8R60_10980 [Mycobacteriales bacterium]|nr:hypothetical protein [Mycobacteriales bacterium]
MAHGNARLWVISGWFAASALVTAWFATGHASAPDDGLLQLDVFTLSERVDGLDAVDGRPTMVVVPGRGCPARTARLSSYPVVLRQDLARVLALPRAATTCQPGYVLLDGSGTVRYRTYDPGWAEHAEEQEILLEHLDDHG